MKKSFLSLVCFLAVFVLTGCGQMGALYLPDQKPTVYVPHPSAKSKH